MGPSSNGLLSVVSIAAATILIGGAAIGCDVASKINLVTGATFYFGGSANLAVLGTQANFLAFRLNDVVFSLALGVTLMAFGAHRVEATHTA